MRGLALVLLGIVLIAPADTFARCGPSRLTRGVTKPEIIKLNALERGVRDAPAFYMQMPETWQVLYFKPDDVVEQLKKTGERYQAEQASFAAKATATYLAAISRDLPLEQDTDLFKYVLESNEFRDRQEFMVSDLLKAGQAHIDAWPYRDAARDPNDDRDDRKTIIMVSKIDFGQEEEWRLFCTSLALDESPKRTREVLFVTYVIVD